MVPFLLKESTMKRRITSILVVIFAMISAPARADVLNVLLIEASLRLLGGAANAVVSTVKEAVVSK